MIPSAIALLLALPAGPSAPPVETDRFLVVFEPRAEITALERLEQVLRTKYDARPQERMTEGAVLGLLVVLDVSRADELGREKAVASVVRVERGPFTGSKPEERFQRGPRGWVVPGLYDVTLVERWGFGLDLPPEQQGLTGVARREALRERREELVRQAAERIAAQYGGRVRSVSASGEPRFECAMTEEAALRMADDERVWRVWETVYGVLGD